MKRKTFSVVWTHTSVRDATTFSAESRSQWLKLQSLFSHQWTQQVLATSQRDTTQPCQWPVTCGHSWSAFLHHFGETTPSALHLAGVLNKLLSHRLQRHPMHRRVRLDEMVGMWSKRWSTCHKGISRWNRWYSWTFEVKVLGTWWNKYMVLYGQRHRPKEEWQFLHQTALSSRFVQWHRHGTVAVAMQTAPAGFSRN